MRCDVRKDTEVRRMAELFHMTQSASFEQSKFGVEGSTLMAQLWANRMNYICTRWLAEGSPTHAFVDAVPTEFRVDEATQTLVDSLGGPAGKRANQIVRLWV
eukprot:749178-Amphidinium_carterae.1